MLARAGISNYRHAARAVSHQDFYDFDYIMAMDENNLEDLMKIRRSIEIHKTRQTKNSNTESESKHLASVHLFGEFGSESKDEEVIDPYCKLIKS